MASPWSPAESGPNGRTAVGELRREGVISYAGAANSGGKSPVAIKYTDKEIEEMMAEPKHPPVGTERRLRLQSKRGQKERRIDLRSDSGTEYHLILCQSTKSVNSFSVVLGVKKPLSNYLFRLRRHNGKSHQHTNRIEKNTISGCHIHYATERYQKLGMREDSFAMATDRYDSFCGAIDCMILDAKIEIPPDAQLDLFGICPS